MKKLAIISSHPIQYNAPLFKALTESGQVQVKVFYTWEQSQLGKKYDPGFGKSIAWDIPLLEGYEYHFTRNIAKEPGSHHFKGIDTPNLVAEVEAWGAEVILVFGWAFKSHLKCLRYFKGRIPVLFRGDSTLIDQKRGWKAIFGDVILKWVYRHVDVALYVGQHNKQYFLRHGLKERQLVHAPHAIDNDRFSATHLGYAEKALAWRKELGIRENDLVLLFAGKFEPKKNPELVLWLAAQIDNPRLKIVLVGNGVEEERLKSSAAQDSRIHFLDFQNQQNMPITYRLGDLFILPSRGPGETWGLAANEAMASGLAVIMSNKTGGGVDLVPKNTTGLLFELNRPADCIRFLENMLADKNELVQLKSAAHQWITQFSFPKVVAAIVETIKRL